MQLAPAERELSLAIFAQQRKGLYTLFTRPAISLLQCLLNSITPPLAYKASGGLFFSNQDLYSGF